MSQTTLQPSKFGAEADAALSKFYHDAKAEIIADKIKALESELGGPANYYAFGGTVSDEMKLGCLEYEYLSLRDLVDLVLV
jgi:hypothetical protein